MSREIAKALLDIGAVGFRPANPVTFKSGVLSPVYCDNRRFPFHPAAWKLVIDGFAAELAKIPCDVVAGVEAAGIPHSAALGFATGKPSVFVRKQAKDHGTKKLVEGGDVTGKQVVLVEDLVTTGISSLAAVEVLRSEGAVVTDALAIISYGFTEAKEAFAEAGVALHTLATFPEILDVAPASADLEEVRAWLADPHAWKPKVTA